ncbi:hypothetical protein EHQ24_01715 [Leptospira noumeaensis]|uniref:Uncharacterized protein n=1 Tax=Leptospira noumeaensis TaxID=2484964 RepID=A0A4R9IGQ0_9LEPT|nr:hypothetical protein [Leptospira noumeaensis]TGK87587.1 hypothetical protein EHQ24_01715 [Leptospira noumeaensis]
MEVNRPTIYEVGHTIAEVANVSFTEDELRIDPRYCLEIDFLNKKLRAAFYNENYVMKKPIIEIPLYEDDKYLYVKSQNGGRIFIFVGKSPRKTDEKSYIYISSNSETIEEKANNDDYSAFNSRKGGDDRLFKRVARYTIPVFPHDNENSKRYNTMEHCINELPELYDDAITEYKLRLKEESEAGKRYMENESKVYLELKKQGKSLSDP